MLTARLFSSRFSFRMAGRLLIGFGSHTGQAESIAAQLKNRAEAVGISTEVRTLNDIEKELDLTKESFLVIIISSTGDGDPPENCARFVRRLNRKGLGEDHLAKLQYCLLGLGDSNYSTYQGIPIKIDHTLSFLGATRLIERGEADDQVGLELIVEPWIDKLFKEVLTDKFNLDAEKLSSAFSSKLSLAAAKDKTEKDRIMEEWKSSSAARAGESGDGLQNGTTKASESGLPRAPSTSLPITEFEYPSGASVRSGAAALTGEANLRVPLAPQPFIRASFGPGPFISAPDATWQNGAPMPGVVSPDPIEAVVVSHSILTALDAKKPKRELIFELTSRMIDYEPGDAFYIVTNNLEDEVDFILDRMNVLDRGDAEYTIEMDPATPKKGASPPPFLPLTSSLRHLFTFCLDIRRAPGRPLLRVLADSASDAGERRRLLELCSAQGVAEFTSFVRQSALSLVDVLLAFPSVRPLPERLIENLPRLMPRPYSVSSCRSKGGNRIRFAYSIRHEDASEGRRYERVGVATRSLCDLRVGQKVQLLEKEPARFRLPPLGLAPEIALYSPLILVGPGTGISTFLSFTQHLREYKKQNAADEKFRDVKRMVFFGCRETAKDFIYKEELECLVQEGIVTDLVVAQSNVEGQPKYVQDCIAERAQEVVSLLQSTASSPFPALLFVCGDAKGMSRRVLDSLVQAAQTVTGGTVDEARKYIMDLKKSDRYVEDVWS